MADPPHIANLPSTCQTLQLVGRSPVGLGSHSTHTGRYCMRMIVGRVFLMIILAVASGCMSVALAPGADQVKTTQNPADVASCKAVGNVDGTEGNPQPTPDNVLRQLQN